MIIKNIPSGPYYVNTYLVEDEETMEAFIVDPGGYDNRMMETIKTDKATIKYIVLTHGHADHIGGVAKYQELFPEAKLVGSKAEMPVFTDPALNETMIILGEPIVINPDIQVEEGDTLEIGKTKFRVAITPGHTCGGMCLIGDGAVFSGDTLFQQSVGRSDLPTGNMKELVNSIRTKLFVLPDETKVFPGHMGMTTIGFEKGHNPFV